jgi:hypothetical protein
MEYRFPMHLKADGARYRTVMFRSDEKPVRYAPVPYLYVSKSHWRETGSLTRIDLVITPTENGPFFCTNLKTKMKMTHYRTQNVSRREVAEMDLPITQVFVKLGVIPADYYDVRIEERNVQDSPDLWR